MLKTRFSTAVCGFIIVYAPFVVFRYLQGGSNGYLYFAAFVKVRKITSAYQLQANYDVVCQYFARNFYEIHYFNRIVIETGEIGLK